MNPWSDLRFVRGALHVSLALACGHDVRPPDLAEIEIVRWLADLLRRGSPPELLEEALRQCDAGDPTVETVVRNMSEFALPLTGPSAREPGRVPVSPTGRYCGRPRRPKGTTCGAAECRAKQRPRWRGKPGAEWPTAPAEDWRHRPHP